MSLSHKLDHEYETTRKKIVKLKPNIHRRRQVRVKNWLKKLDEPTTVLTWQRLRNKYAKNLVKQMTTEKDFSFPFNKNAPDVLKNFQAESKVKYQKKHCRKHIHLGNNRMVNNNSNTRNITKNNEGHRNSQEEHHIHSSYLETLGEMSKANHHDTNNSNYRHSHSQHETHNHQQSHNYRRSDNIEDKSNNNYYLQQTHEMKDDNSNIQNQFTSTKNIIIEQSTKRWRTKAMQLEKIVAGQKIRIIHLEQELKYLKAGQSREIERLEKFHEVQIDDLSRVQTNNLKKLKEVQELHPAEKELISMPGNAMFEFDAVLSAAKSIPLNQHEEKNEAKSFYTTLSQINLNKNDKTDNKKKQYSTNRNYKADTIQVALNRKGLQSFIAPNEMNDKDAAVLLNKQPNELDYFNYLDKFQQSMKQIVLENKTNSLNLSVTMNSLNNGHKNNYEEKDNYASYNSSSNINGGNIDEISILSDIHDNTSSVMNISEL